MTFLGTGNAHKRKLHNGLAGTTSPQSANLCKLVQVCSARRCVQLAASIVGTVSVHCSEGCRAREQRSCPALDSSWRSQLVFHLGHECQMSCKALCYSRRCLLNPLRSQLRPATNRKNVLPERALHRFSGADDGFAGACPSAGTPAAHSSSWVDELMDGGDVHAQITTMIVISR